MGSRENKNGVNVCGCGHAVWWHNDTRGCGYKGFDPRHKCPCPLLAHEAVDAVVTREKARERESVIREFEALADFWTLSKGWVGPVALHDFRRKIDALRFPPGSTSTQDPGRG